jgi:hypothetical protein
MNNLLKYITNIFFQIAKTILAITVVFALSKHASAQIKEKSYYELQAEVVYNFIGHVNWLNSDHGNKKLCVIEDNPVIPYLQAILRNKNDNIILIRKNENDYLDECQILFVSDNYDGYLQRLLFRVKGKQILTFGSLKNFAESGGIVQFTLRNNRVEFMINTKEMKSSGFRISDSILAVSDTIN